MAYQSSQINPYLECMHAVAFDRQPLWGVEERRNRLRGPLSFQEFSSQEIPPAPSPENPSNGFQNDLIMLEGCDGEIADPWNYTVVQAHYTNPTRACATPHPFVTPLPMSTPQEQVGTEANRVPFRSAVPRYERRGSLDLRVPTDTAWESSQNPVFYVNTPGNGYTSSDFRRPDSYHTEPVSTGLVLLWVYHQL